MTPNDIDVTLREYIEACIESQEKLFNARFEQMMSLGDARFSNVQDQFVAIRESTRVALEALNTHLRTMNEFRAAMEDLTKTFVTKDLFCQFTDSSYEDRRLLREDMKAMSVKHSNLEGKLTAYASAIIFAVTLISLAIKFIP